MTLAKLTDRSIERMVSIILRSGVLVSGLVVLSGGLYFLARHGQDPVDYRRFHGEPSVDRLVPEILGGVRSLRARSVIQFGLLLLIATPIARVAFSVLGFALERDYKYVTITTVVLAILLYSLIAGGMGHV
jgi:uncharacterized membrane protein